MHAKEISFFSITIIGENVNSMCRGKQILDFHVHVTIKSVLNTVYNGQRPCIQI